MLKWVLHGEAPTLPDRMQEKPNTQKLFEACVETCADSMYRVAFRLCGNAGEAEDLVQETYVQAWQKIDSLRDPNRMRSWMFAILRNQHLKAIRKKRPIATGDVQSLEAPSVPVEPNSDPADVVQQALMQLEQDQRMPILLVSMEGLSAEEASGILGIPRGTVLSRMHRGRKRLKEIIEKLQPEERL